MRNRKYEACFVKIVSTMDKFILCREQSLTAYRKTLLLYILRTFPLWYIFSQYINEPVQGQRVSPIASLLSLCCQLYRPALMACAPDCLLSSCPLRFPIEPLWSHTISIYNVITFHKSLVNFLYFTISCYNCIPQLRGSNWGLQGFSKILRIEHKNQILWQI